MKMKKMMILMLSLFFLGSAGMNAQVLISGSSLDPEDGPTPGSVLDLQSGGSLGLLLPGVTLTDASVWAPVDGSAVEGMTVFNNSDALAGGLTGKGIYVWVNGAWSRMGAPAIPCVNIVASATTASFVGKGAVQTLEVNVTSGSGPFNYSWYLDGNLLQDHSNVSERTDVFVTGAYGNYICKVSNSCNLVDVNFYVNAIDEGDYTAPGNQPTDPAIKWDLTGVTCFDVRENQGFGDSESEHYTLAVTGATVTGVVWQYTGLSAVLNGAQSESTTGVTIPFKTRAAISAAASSPVTVQVKALITMTAGSPVKTYKVVKTLDLKFQNQTCCDGAIIYGAAWNYASGSLPGDGAKVGGADATTDKAWSPNITATGSWNATALDSYFTKANIDLCVYKKNYKSSGDTNGTTTWVNAVNNCANGTYADGDATVGWYLPNERELQSIYQAIGGSGGSAVNFGNLTSSTGTIATTAENMVSYYYWSSTENSATIGLLFNFSNGYRDSSGIKAGNGYVRCVRRL